jgi:hypothetical protein
VVALTIIGLPYDTEETIMTMAEWVTQLSTDQTVNILTPLPATSHWDDLTPLDENGDLLQPGQMRPYHLYTGRQLVHQDERWTMEESRALFDRYSERLTPVDDLYRRIFRILRTYRLRLAASSRELGDTITARISEAAESLRDWSDPVAIAGAGKGIGDNISVGVNDLSEKLRAVSQPLANARREVVENVGTRVSELTESLRVLSDPMAPGRNDLALSISGRITELEDILDGVVKASPQKSRRKPNVKK